MICLYTVYSKVKFSVCGFNRSVNYIAQQNVLHFFRYLICDTSLWRDHGIMFQKYPLDLLPLFEDEFRHACGHAAFLSDAAEDICKVFECRLLRICV